MPPELQLDVALFVHGGLAILEAIRRQDYDVWTARPKVSKWEKLGLVARCWWRLQRGHALGEAEEDKRDSPGAELEASYAACRRLVPPGELEFSRRLPPPAGRPSAAPWTPCMPSCATRDDLVDAASATPRRRPGRVAIGPGSLPCGGDVAMPALRHRFDGALLCRRGRRRRSLPDSTEHLRAVLDGVEMDLVPPRYETFADLVGYCERVASAVGLACIHVWGFRGPEALGFRPAPRASPCN